MKTPAQLALDFGPHRTALDAQAANEARICLSTFKAREQDRFYRSKAWRRMRAHALAKFGARCCACGCTNHDARIDVDHIVPRSIAPQLALCVSNLQVLCEACHESKTYRDGLRARPAASGGSDRRRQAR